MNHRVEVTEDDAPLDLLKISGKKVYFLQANSKLFEMLKKLNKKYKKSEDYTVIPLRSDKEEYVVHPTCLKVRECNVPEHFYILTKFNQYNWIIPRGKFLFYHTIHLNLFFQSCCLFYYFLDLCPPTVNELGLLCGLFQFYHELALSKKTEDDNDNTFNSYEYRLYGLRCADQQDVEKAQQMKLAFEGYIRATLFHGIFYIVPSDFADDNNVEIPGTVKTTKLQFKKFDNPNWLMVPKKTA